LVNVKNMETLETIGVGFAIGSIMGLVGYIVLSLFIEDIKEKEVMSVIKSIIGKELENKHKGIELKDIKLELGTLEVYVIIKDKDVVDLKEKITNEIGSKSKDYFQSCNKHVFNVKVIFEESWIVNII